MEHRSSRHPFAISHVRRRLSKQPNSGHWTRLKVSGWMGHLRSYLIDRRLSSVDLITILDLFENTSVLNRNEVLK